MERWQEEQTEKQDLEFRLQQLQKHLDDVGYTYRLPTIREIATMQKKWLDEHPFTYSGRMPDFSKQQIREPKINSQNPESAQARQAEIAALSARVTELEKRLASHPMPANDHVRKAARHVSAATAKGGAATDTTTPAPPNPANITLRKLADGRVLAIVGSTHLEFQNEAEANAYIEKVRQDSARQSGQNPAK